MSQPVRLRLEIAADHPAFAGHFPGQPILPGVALLAEVIEATHEQPALAAALGSEPRIAVVKFLGAVRPGASLMIEFRLCERALDWRAMEGTRLVASGQFARADAARVPVPAAARAARWSRPCPPARRAPQAAMPGRCRRPPGRRRRNVAACRPCA